MLNLPSWFLLTPLGVLVPGLHTFATLLANRVPVVDLPWGVVLLQVLAAMLVIF